MFQNSVQSSLVSLFSSTGSDPLQLFSVHVDKALPEDSFVHLLNDSSNEPSPPTICQMIKLSHDDDDADATQNINDDDSANLHYARGSESVVVLTPPARRTLCQTVLHIQSPTLRTTYVRCPPEARRGSSTADIDDDDDDDDDARRRNVLGLRHPWVHLQVRNLEREWAFEIGVVDLSGKPGVIRCSTFQVEAAVKAQHDPPLLLLPLRFPSESSRPLTAWATISLDIPSLMPRFQSIASAQSKKSVEEADTEGEEDDGNSHLHNVPLPGPQYASTTYVKIYATCRLRRVWFSETRVSSDALPWEFRLYGAQST